MPKIDEPPFPISFPCSPAPGSLNVSFKYLYRDAGNYKLHGEAVFTNSTSLCIEEIEKQIRACLQDGEFFIARQVHIEERFFDVLNEEEDHSWHEFCLVEMTGDPAFDPRHDHKRDVTEFIADLEKANRDGWDETNVRADLMEMLEKQKLEMKRTLDQAKIP